MDENMKNLEALRQRARVAMLFSAAVYVPALVLFIAQKLVAGMVAAALAVALYWLLARRMQKRYSAEYARLSALCGLGARLDNAAYTPRERIFTQDDLPAFGCPACKENTSRPLCCHVLRGTWRGGAARVCEMTFGCHVGEKRNAWRFFSGTAVQIALPQSGRCEALLLSHGTFDGSFARAQYEEAGWQSTACVAWDEKRDGLLLTRGETPAEGWLNNLTGLFFTLCGENGACALHVGKDCLTAFLRGRFFSPEATLQKKPDEAEVTENQLPPFDTLLEIADFLRENPSKGETA